jgi:predicted cupin superfamily sugar epimerase
MNNEAARIVERLALKPHPEGGYYREIYRSPSSVRILDRDLERSAGTAVYYLLADSDFSAFNLVQGSDEVWHLYVGGPVELHVIEGGSYTVKLLSSDLEQALRSRWSRRERGKRHASPPTQNGRCAAALCRRASTLRTSRSRLATRC